MSSRPDSSISTRKLPIHWRLLEAWFQRAYRVEPLSPDPGCLLAYSRLSHHGPEVRLRCGTVVRDGDPILEIHFRREALAPLVRLGDPALMGLELIRLGDRDVPRLARALEEDPRLREVKALHAMTLFHRGIQRYGFEVQPVRPALQEAWFTLWQRLLMARDHPQGGARVREHAERLVVRHIWVSREALIRGCAEREGRRQARRSRREASPPGGLQP